jgi:hypothetical protein
MQGLLLRAATTTTRRRKPVVTTSHWLAPPLPQLLLQGLAEVEGHEVTSTPVKHPSAMTVAHDGRYITPRAIVRVSAGRSRSPWNSFARSNSNHTKKARLPASGGGGKQKMDPKEDKDEETTFQNTKREMKVVYGHSDSDSSNNKCCKALHVMFGGSWDLTSRRIIKTLGKEVAAIVPTPRVAPHHKWMEMPISFDASDCPKSMAGAGQLPLIVSPTIVNIKLYHILIDICAALNLISLIAIKKLQILMSKL